MEIITEGSRSVARFTSPAAFMAAEQVPRHGMGGMSGKDPKFVSCVRLKGFKDPVPFEFAPRKPLSVSTPRPAANDDMPASYELPLESLPDWKACVQKQCAHALEVCCSFEPGSYWSKEGKKFVSVVFAHCAEHYIKRTYPDTYKAALTELGLDGAPPDWSAEQRARMSELLKQKLTEPDEEGKTKYKPALNERGGMWVGLRNFKKGAPITDREGVPLPQSSITEAVGGTEADRGPEEFLRATMCGPGTDNPERTSVTLDVIVEPKHVFAFKGKNITNGWHIKHVTYLKPKTGATSRPKSVLCVPEEEEQPPPRPVKKEVAATKREPEEDPQADPQAEPPAKAARVEDQEQEEGQGDEPAAEEEDGDFSN